MVEITKGNLFKTDTEAIVNTVNTVGVMGKGIALQFKKAFSTNFQAYKKACDNKEVKIGEMFVFETGQMVNPKYIINFPTKRHWKEKSKLEYIDLGLKDLINVVHKRSIRSLAIPPLGCGLGGLNWQDVQLLIKKYCDELPNLKVFLFEPAGAPDPREMKIFTKPPNMTYGRAALLGLMNCYFVPGYDYPLSLLEIQKLAYFLQEAGEKLRLTYQKHYYGPYADNLRHVLNRIEGHFIIGYGDGNNKPFTPIKLDQKAIERAKKFLMDYPETKNRFNQVSELIEGFETPFGMELISSVHWVSTYERSKEKSDLTEIINNIQSWNDRKKKYFKPNHIKAAWKRLLEKQWIS